MSRNSKRMNTMRLAKITDLKDITEIYNQAVLSGFETADMVVTEPEERIEWFNGHKENVYPVFVYELDKKVVGWVSVSPYRPGRKALRYTVEISYYVHKDFKRKGIGSRLIEYVSTRCRELNYKTIIAIILDKNIASIKLLAGFGFERWGHLPNVADFNGVECGHLIYGRKI